MFLITVSLDNWKSLLIEATNVLLSIVAVGEFGQLKIPLTLVLYTF
jgi:hypothetical protein